MYLDSLNAFLILLRAYGLAHLRTLHCIVQDNDNDCNLLSLSYLGQISPFLQGRCGVILILSSMGSHSPAPEISSSSLVAFMNRTLLVTFEAKKENSLHLVGFIWIDGFHIRPCVKKLIFHGIMESFAIL
jgi:hypothetical protein